jgi:hypothetical protein
MSGHTPARAQLSAEVIASIVAAAPGRLIVVGSLPPTGRDLDLLVRKADRERVERALLGKGLLRRGSTYALFGGFSAYGVDLIDAESFLAPKPLEDLFAAARSVHGLEPLAQPCPGHALLILARIASEEGELTRKRCARLERILQEDPNAWLDAWAAAPEWRAAGELAQLEGLAGDVGSRLGHPMRRARRQAGRLRRRRSLVTLSGLDGSGKSSQARWLAEALAELEIDVEVIWNDLQGNVLLDALGVPAKALLRLRGRPVRPMSSYEQVAPSAHRSHDAVRRVWSSIVTLANSLEQRALATRGRVRGRTIVFDRGPLDLAVRMEVLYRTGGGRQPRLIELTAPRSTVAFLLEVSPDLALSRKLDIWSDAQLEEQATLYKALAPRFGARRIDGGRAPEDIAAEIAGAVWQRLP